MTLTVLLVDNEPDFLQTRAEFLTQEGYQVITADSPAAARQALKTAPPDILITDVRLLDDDDERDTSGLTLIQDVDPQIPKIVLTGFPSVNAVRHALRPRGDGQATAVDFIGKQEGPEAMLSAVRRAVAVHIQKQPRQVSLNISVLLEQDYAEARRQAILTHRIRLILITVGAVVIVAGAIDVIWRQSAAGILSIVSGILIEALGALFAKLSEDANKRMDRYHKELLKLYQSSE
ncbi:MAG: response regulator [bacterium]|nr:response regulator [bacterium]